MDALWDLVARGFDDLLGRSGGPLRFRLVVMPTVVVFLAIRAHLRDVRAGKPVLVGSFFTSPAERRRLLRSALKDVGRVFVIACVLDTTYQFLVLRSFYPIQMLIVAVVCAVVPYVLVRGPVTRIAHSYLRRRDGADGTSEAAEKADADDRERSG